MEGMRYDLMYAARSFVVRAEEIGFLMYISSFSINVCNARLNSPTPSKPAFSISSRLDVVSRSRPCNGCVLRSMGSTLMMSVPGNCVWITKF